MEIGKATELLQALHVKSTKMQNGRLVGGYVDKENETNKAIDKAIGVLRLIEKWGLADLSLDELDRWRDRGRWHVDYVANERWKEESLEVFVLMKEYVESKEVVLDGVFSSMEKLNKHIQSSDESGDYVEHGITKVEVR